MHDLIANERIIGAKDWATCLFVFCFAVIAISRTVFETRFAEFIKLGISNKYTKIYKDSSNLLSWFTISFFVIQVISYAFLLQFALGYYKHIKINALTFVQLVTIIAFFILAKYLVEKIIATAFSIEEFNEQFNLYKINYRTYIGLLLLPVNVALFYNVTPTAPLLYIILGIIIAATVASYLISLRIYQKLILAKLFYFILYLCALEIAPYYFMYYWFTNS